MGRNTKKTVPSKLQLKQLPKVLAVYHGHGRHCRIKVIEQSCINPDAAGCFVPASIRLKGRAVSERATTAHRAKVMRHEFGVPTVRRVIDW